MNRRAVTEEVNTTLLSAPDSERLEGQRAGVPQVLTSLRDNL